MQYNIKVILHGNWEVFMLKKLKIWWKIVTGKPFDALIIMWSDEYGTE